jgi:MFS family permease
MHAAVSTARSDRSATELASEVYHHQPAADLAPHAIVQTAEFHLLFFWSFVTMGAGLALLDNLPQLLRATAPATQDLVTLERHGHVLLVGFSVCNTLGRILAGFLSEQALHQRVRSRPPSSCCWRGPCRAHAACMQGTPRTVFCVINAVLTVAWTAALLATTALLAETPWAYAPLVPITLLAGITFGAAWTLMSVTTSEMFGLKYFSINYATINVAPIVATAVCPNLLVGRLYDREARRQHPDMHGEDVPCSGAACFRSAFAVLVALSLLVRPRPCSFRPPARACMRSAQQLSVHGALHNCNSLSRTAASPGAACAWHACIGRSEARDALMQRVRCARVVQQVLAALLLLWRTRSMYAAEADIVAKAERIEECGSELSSPSALDGTDRPSGPRRGPLSPPHRTNSPF